MFRLAAAAAIVVACGCSGAAAGRRTNAATPCGGGEIAQGSVSRVEDGQDLRLRDGRDVHLAGIEGAARAPRQRPAAGRGGTTARNALAALFAGAQVRLRRAAYGPDRYGRIVAYAYAVRGSAKHLAQAQLLSAGLARVGDFVGASACAAELLRRERAARAAKLGLWASPFYAILQAGDPASVLAQRGRFALVEGKVVSVHQSGTTLYVNFGRDWSDDFTITIRRRNKRRFAAAGLDLRRLAGRRIRVRGWIERRGGWYGAPWGGPSIEAAHPVQIEALDGLR